MSDVHVPRTCCDKCGAQTKCRRNRDAFIDVTNLDLYKEADRLRSFVENDWSNEFVDYEELALLGFYFYKGPDVVKCFCCHIKLNEFEPDDKVLKEHLRFSPNCPLLIRRRTDNEPLSSEKLNKALPKASFDECGGLRKRSRVEEDVVYPQYRLPSARMQTFELWPVGIKQKPEDLCAAGFFYSGRSDCTICFACGVHIGKWEADDNPWVEHKKLLARDCSYLQLNSDQLKINEKKVEQENNSIVSTTAETTNVHENCGQEIDDESLCKICFSNKVSIALLPCKHVAICGQCVFGINGKCPICRAEITDTIKLYYS